MTQQKRNRNSNAGYIKVVLIFLYLGLVSNLTTLAQEQFVPPLAKRITKFPFTQLTGGIVIIEAKLGDFSDTLNFILDTGSGGISLDSLTVEYFNLEVTASDRTIRGIAGIKNVSFVIGQKLRLPGLVVDSLNFHINDYSILTSVYGVKIDGIIGYSFLSRYIVKMDYENFNMEVWEPGVIKYPRGGFLLKPPINAIPIIGGKVSDGLDVFSRFYFDSGAGLALLFSEDFIRDSSFLKKKKKITVTQAEGLGGKKQMRITTVKEFKVGPYRFRKVPTYIFEDDFNATSYPQLGGLVGNDIFRRFNTVFNYPEKEIHLLPNKRFAEPFDYAYTGLGIFLIDGEVTVEDVIKDSPGEKAGFKSGDVIYAIGKDFSQNIQAYKALLQNAGAKLKILVMRDGKLVFLTLNVRSIL
ncbi:MAG TPA: aspartyl protease family protein [Segetibacter sp.]